MPREWIAPPDHDTADGELLDEDDDDERVAMLRATQSQGSLHLTDSQDQYSTDEELESSRSRSRNAAKRSTSSTEIGRPRRSSVRDTSGREIPASERAPVHARS